VAEAEWVDRVHGAVAVAARRARSAAVATPDVLRGGVVLGSHDVGGGADDARADAAAARRRGRGRHLGRRRRVVVVGANPGHTYLQRPGGVPVPAAAGRGRRPPEARVLRLLPPPGDVAVLAGLHLAVAARAAVRPLVDGVPVPRCRAPPPPDAVGVGQAQRHAHRHAPRLRRRRRTGRHRRAAPPPPTRRAAVRPRLSVHAQAPRQAQHARAAHAVDEHPPRSLRPRCRAPRRPRECVPITTTHLNYAFAFASGVSDHPLIKISSFPWPACRGDAQVGAGAHGRQGSDPSARQESSPGTWLPAAIANPKHGLLVPIESTSIPGESFLLRLAPACHSCSSLGQTRTPMQ
jgi:hypothetical protein